MNIEFQLNKLDDLIYIRFSKNACSFDLRTITLCYSNPLFFFFISTMPMWDSKGNYVATFGTSAYSTHMIWEMIEQGVKANYKNLK